MKTDWTYNPETHRCNDSELFHELERRIAYLIRSSASLLLAGHAESVAGLILAQLAHVHDFGPVEREKLPAPPLPIGERVP